MTRKPVFITLEGIEGSGKTTQTSRLVAFMEEMGYECVVTREPGGTLIGKKIRAILLDPENAGLDPLAELLLYAADRAQHIRKVIKPALAEGKAVICDRFADATTVYQGFARGLDLDLIMRIHRIVLNELAPDLTLLFDVTAQTGLARARGAIANGDRDHDESRFENEALAFHERVRNGYLKLARKEPDRFHIIDAGRNADEVTQQMLHIVSQFVKTISRFSTVLK